MCIRDSSVGGPYFNSTVLPILLPGFLLMSIAPVLSWQSNKIKKFKVYVLFFLILSFFVIIYSYFTNFNIWGFLGLILGCWIILASIISIILRFKFVVSFNIVVINKMKFTQTYSWRYPCSLETVHRVKLVKYFYIAILLSC